jgi:hypothetical protein
MCELLAFQVINLKVESGSATRVGLITERFTNGAVVAKMSNVELRLGDTFYVCGESCCYPALVNSIQLNGDPQEGMVVTVETEIGLLFDRDVKSNRKLYRVK